MQNGESRVAKPMAEMIESSIPDTLSLSVIIPTYNRKDVLLRALDGLARQTYSADRFEVIVVSDGSTDGTNEAVTAYRAPYRLRLIQQHNSGPSGARNRGIREATGQIVVFLDDDVEPEPSFLAAHAKHHIQDNAVAVIGPMNRSRDRRGREPAWVVWEHEMLAALYRNLISGIWGGVGPNHFYSGNASVSRAYLLAISGFDETFKRQEDVELAYRLNRVCGVRCLFDPEAAGWHRPERTYASWRKTPYAYGQLDVIRARRGDVKWELVRKSYYERNSLTRLLAQAALTFPVLERILESGLLGIGRLLYCCHLMFGLPERISLVPLSVLFNLRYLEGAREEMGGNGLRRLLKASRNIPREKREA